MSSEERTKHFPTETRYEEVEAMQWAPWPRGPRNSSQTVYLKVRLIYHVLQCQLGALLEMHTLDLSLGTYVLTICLDNSMHRKIEFLT